MNNEEAKFLLSAYRAGGQDAKDPQFAEALEQARRDPSLRAWFEEQQSIDAKLSDAIRSVPVPSDLKSAILAGRKTVRPVAWHSRRSFAVALAASIVVLLGLGGLLLPWGGDRTLSALRSDMSTFLTDLEAGRESLDVKIQDVQKIRSWLAEHTGGETVALPESLQGRSGMGCRVIEWRGERVLLACFQLESGQLAHLLVVDRAALEDPPQTAGPQFVLAGAMSTASWSEGDHTYLLASRAGQAELERLL